MNDIFFKISESESFRGQNRPVRIRRKPLKLIEEASLISDDEDSNFAARPACKQKKQGQNRLAGKQKKGTKLIEEVSIVSDDEDSTIAAGSNSKKSKEDKKG